MIRSFRNRDTEEIWYGIAVRRPSIELQRVARWVMSERLPNIHPGEVLLEEFLRPLSVSQNRLARDIKVPPRRVNEIVLGKRSITPDTALRLSRYFGTSERFWLGLQIDFDLEEARRHLAAEIEREIRPIAPAA